MYPVTQVVNFKIWHTTCMDFISNIEYYFKFLNGSCHKCLVHILHTVVWPLKYWWDCRWRFLFLLKLKNPFVNTQKAMQQNYVLLINEIYTVMLLWTCIHIIYISLIYYNNEDVVHFVREENLHSCEIVWIKIKLIL